MSERKRVAAPAPGVYENVAFAEYASWNAINQSALKLADRSLRHVRHALETVNDEPSEALLIGQAVHALALEGGDAFAGRFHAMPSVDGRTKEGKAAKAAAIEAAKGKAILTETQWNDVHAMAERIRRHPRAGAMIGASGKPETCIVWMDSRTGLKCKMRMDRIVVGGITPDVKTTRDASPAGFRSAIAKYGYAEQQAFYEMGYRSAFGDTPEFCIIAVENEPPHCVAVYVIGDDTMRIARKRIRLWLDQVGHANRSGDWNGYADAIEEIDAPEWWIKSSDPLTCELEEVA